MGKHYVFSDIHGNYTLFNKIKKFLKADDVCYVLGDCADRGDKGYTIIKEVIADERFIYIKGNHEDLFASSVLTRRYDYMNCWFSNGGMKTFDEFKEDNPPIEFIKTINTLPLIETYTSKDGVQYIMSHAGFCYEQPDALRDYLWDRTHFYATDNIPDNIVLIHGHTPVKYLLEESVDGKQLKCENDKTKSAFYLYNNGRKLDIDCGTAFTGFIALYCLDNNKVYGFNERSD